VTRILELLETAAPELAARNARRFANHPNERLRLRAALILVRSGDSLHLLERLLRGLANAPPLARVAYRPELVHGYELPEVVQTLLDRKTPEARRVARLVLEGEMLRKARDFKHSRAAILRPFFAAGLPDAHRYYAEWMQRVGAGERESLFREFVKDVARGEVPARFRPPASALAFAFVEWLEQESRRLAAKGR
jgi:hypothetical protein